MSECDHILGYNLHYYEGWWPIYNGENLGKWADEKIVFNYCPICGEKLEKE